MRTASEMGGQSANECTSEKRVQSKEAVNAKTEINRNFYCGYSIKLVLRNRCPIWRNRIKNK